MSEPRCIICGERREGLEVVDDRMIGAMRWFKRNVTRNEKRYRLVVCKADFPKYKKARDRYMTKQVAYVAIGAIFGGSLVVVSSHRLEALAIGLAITLFMYLLAQLSYMPALDMPKPRERSRSGP